MKGVSGRPWLCTHADSGASVGWMLPCRQCTINPATALARLAPPQAIASFGSWLFECVSVVLEAGIKSVQATTCISTGAKEEANFHP